MAELSLNTKDYLLSNKTKKITIGYISPNHPDDRKASSGTLYSIIQSLRSIRDVEVLWIPISYNSIWDRIIRLKKMIERKTHVSIPISLEKYRATAVKKTISNALVEQCDVLFCAFQSPSLYRFDTTKPIIYLSDATYATMVNYYYPNHNKREQRDRNLIEQYALDHASAILLGSQWAANSAIRNYKQSSDKVHVVEFGANIDIKDIIQRDFVKKDHLDLLFLGVDWLRKGGKIAIETCQWLNDNGVPSTLHVVGIKELPDSISALPFVDHIGFLDKNKPNEYNQLISIIQECQCLLLPTMAECAGIAFCEASAYGLPSFSHITGGVPNYVIDGVNGYLLPIGSKGEDFGKKIKKCFESGELEKMSHSAVNLYKEKLNWFCWSQKVGSIINALTSSKNK